MEAREGYKKTKIGWIPEDWSIVKFEDVVELGKSKVSPNDNENIRCIELEHIEQRTGRLLGYATTNGKTSIKTVFERGDILFGKLRPNLMKYCCPDFDGVCSTEILVFRATQKADNIYTFNIVQTDGFLNNAISKSFGTKMPRTDWKIVKEYSFPLPSIPEQQKIAEILTTVDEKIVSIEDRIQQTKQLKKGLMEKLLTEGVGHTEFKDTKIGRIPVCWDVLAVGEVYEKSVDLGDDTYPIASVSIDLGIVRREMIKRQLISELAPEKHLLVKKGYLAYNMMRMWQGASDIAEFDCIVSPAYVVCKPRSDVIPKYSKYYFKSPKIINLLKRFSKGITEDRWRLYYKDFCKIPFVYPPISEQKKVASILSTVDDKLDVLQAKKANYETLKKGLMEQLLTGKMRVKP